MAAAPRQRVAAYLPRLANLEVAGPCPPARPGTSVTCSRIPTRHCHVISEAGCGRERAARTRRDGSCCPVNLWGMRRGMRSGAAAGYPPAGRRRGQRARGVRAPCAAACDRRREPRPAATHLPRPAVAYPAARAAAIPSSPCGMPQPASLARSQRAGLWLVGIRSSSAGSGPHTTRVRRRVSFSRTVNLSTLLTLSTQPAGWK
jgi:hypothetical protein